LASVLEKLDRPDEALPHAQQAMRIRDRNDSEPPQRRGDARFMVARLLGRDPAQRALALEQAQRAEDAYREAGDDATDERTQLERWRSQRRHRP
jgi:hypothetical protein